MNVSKKEKNKMFINGEEKILNIFIAVIPIPEIGAKIIPIIKRNGELKKSKIIN
jgi:hypothetical protein